MLNMTQGIVNVVEYLHQSNSQHDYWLPAVEKILEKKSISRVIILVSVTTLLPCTEKAAFEHSLSIFRNKYMQSLYSLWNFWIDQFR